MTTRGKLTPEELKFRRAVRMLNALDDDRLVAYLRDIAAADWGLGQGPIEVARSLLWEQVRELISLGVIKRRMPGTRT